MTLDPILSAPLLIQLRVAAALPALLPGPFALFRNRRDRWHKRPGYDRTVSMLVLAVSGFFIPARVALVALARACRRRPRAANYPLRSQGALSTRARTEPVAVRSWRNW